LWSGADHAIGEFYQSLASSKDAGSPTQYGDGSIEVPDAMYLPSGDQAIAILAEGWSATWIIIPTAVQIFTP